MPTLIIGSTRPLLRTGKSARLPIVNTANFFSLTPTTICSNFTYYKA